ncbi:MAG: sulfate adenylyltransferase subunit CysN [Acidobacteriaceae bacterium]|jgi:sulfate adenylyltransferase large subunit
MAAQSQTFPFADPTLSDVADQRVDALLAAERRKELLRFTTAGSVDDGKSTLIGRLLYDSNNVYDDHIASVTRDSGIDFAQLTDGLRAEREQGITIDVAYRYFSTPKRKFIIADTPGHEQYTRNMATGASTADVAVVLVDARKGILDQTRRHACIAALLGISTVIAAVNKMDLTGFSQEIFDQHRRDLLALSEALGIPELIAVPVSALDGDNVVHRSARTPWYGGASLLEILETIPLARDRAPGAFRLPVQRVIRPDQDFRGFAGQIASGVVRPGDEVIALPSGVRSRVRSIVTWDGDLAEARAPQSVVLTLEDEADISRGDMLANVATRPQSTKRFSATVVWMHARPLRPGHACLLKHTTHTVRARVTEIRSRINVERLTSHPSAALELNGIGEVVIETQRPLIADLYRNHRLTGSFILIDASDNATAGAGMIRAFEDATQSILPGGVIVVGNRSLLALDLEARLLDRGALVLRTRISDRDALLPLVLAGAVVISESTGDEAVTIISRDGEERPAPSGEDPEAILRYLETITGRGPNGPAH